MDSKEDNSQKQSANSGFFNSILAKFSPHKASSAQSKEMELRRGLQTTNKKKRKVYASPYKAKRTVPSPIESPPKYDENNGNFDNSPLDPYHQQQQQQQQTNPDHSGFYEDEPMSPTNVATQQQQQIQTEKQSQVRRSKRLESQNQQLRKESPPKAQQQQRRRVPESPGVSPSFPNYKNMQTRNRNLSPIKLPFEVKQPTDVVVKSSSKCKMV